jgi:hypothetical protein
MAAHGFNLGQMPLGAVGDNYASGPMRTASGGSNTAINAPMERTFYFPVKHFTIVVSVCRVVMWR